MTPTPYQLFRQKTRRIWQKSTSDFRYRNQKIHLTLLQKLYSHHGLDLQLTCMAFPEQYEVYLGSDKVAYLRLRGGQFTVEYPDVMGEMLLFSHPDGDGMFEDYERLKFMCRALRAINERIDLIQ